MTFAFKFIALKTATELVKELCYNVCMMGILLENAANIFCGNYFIIRNSTVSELTLKKKHVLIYHHLVQEACAARISWVAKVSAKQTSLIYLLNYCQALPCINLLLNFIFNIARPLSL